MLPQPPPQPPCDAPRYTPRLDAEPKARSVHCELGIMWYHLAEPARDHALCLTKDTGITHFVVALDYGTLQTAADGCIRRAGVRDEKTGNVIGSKMFLPFCQASLAAFVDSVRRNPAFGPSCLNLYEEANVSRPRRVGFDLEFELGHTLKDGTLDHRACAAALWPTDYEAVASDAGLFLERAFVGTVLTAFNAMAGTSLTTRDCFVLDSSSASKLSFHISTPVVLRTPLAVELFRLWMRSTFKSGAAAPISPLVDVGVYSARSNMRLPLCRKPSAPGAAADKPWLRPRSRVGTIEFAPTHDDATPEGEHTHMQALLRQHMWTVCSESPLSDSPDLEPRLEAWASSSAAPTAARSSEARPMRAPRVGASLDRVSNLPDPAVTAAYAAYVGVPAGDVAVISARGKYAVLRAPGQPGADTLFFTEEGDIFLTTARNRDVAVGIVERALSAARAASFDDWFGVGNALHSIDPGPSMLAVWDSFSQRCPAKYTPGECSKRWPRFQDKNSLATLITMAREDSPLALEAVFRSAARPVRIEPARGVTGAKRAREEGDAPPGSAMFEPGPRLDCRAIGLSCEDSLPSFNVFKPGLLRSKLARALKATDFWATWSAPALGDVLEEDPIVHRWKVTMLPGGASRAFALTAGCRLRAQVGTQWMACAVDCAPELRVWFEAAWAPHLSTIGYTADAAGTRTEALQPAPQMPPWHHLGRLRKFLTAASSARPSTRTLMDALYQAFGAELDLLDSCSPSPAQLAQAAAASAAADAALERLTEQLSDAEAEEREWMAVHLAERRQAQQQASIITSDSSEDEASAACEDDE